MLYTNAGKFCSVVVSALVFLSWGLATAQVIRGSLRGRVVDESGGRLAGVPVTIVSPALLGGPHTGRTNDDGQFRFPALEPGVYRLEIQAGGFAPYREDGIRVQVGGTVEKDIELSLRAVTEAVLVDGRGPLVDTRATGVGTNYDSEILRNVPVGRNSVYDFILSAPGASPTSPTRLRFATFLGAGINESTYLLDGTDVTSPRYGIARPSPGTDIIEEVEIQSLGASAEYGNLQGGVLNVVTRQGGDRFRFDASYYGQWSALTSQPLGEDCSCPEGESGFERDLYRDFNAYLGGPIAKERAWFFGGFNIRWDFSSEPGADPRFPSEDKVDGFSGKVNWQLTPGLRLTSSLHYNRWSFPDRTANAFIPYETTATRSGDSLATTLAHLTHMLGANTLGELRVSTASFTSGLTPRNGGITTPARLDIATGAFSGGALYFGDTVERKTDVRAKLSHYASEFLESDHDFRFGAQLIVAASEGYYAYPGAVHYLDYGGEPFIARFRDTYSYGGAFDNVGVFVEDSVRVGERLTLDLGLRFDYSRAENPDVPEYDARGNETGDTIPGRGHLYSWSVFSPRLGLSLKLTDDALTLLRAFYGGFHPGILTTELQAVSPGFGPITVASYDPAAQSYSSSSVIDPLSNVQVDPDTRSPYTRQLSIGIERGLGRDWAVGASYVRRTGGDFTGWMDVTGVYGREVIRLPDGTPLQVFPLETPPDDRLFLLTNRDDYSIEYDGLLVTAEKRGFDDWQLYLSYGYSRATGLQSQNVPSAAAGQGSVTTSFNTFGRDPNDATNAKGLLPNDRTHILRAQGTWQIPRLEILVGAQFQYLTGRPYTAQANVALPQGSRAIYIEPLGSRRLTSQELLDLRVAKILSIGPTKRVEVLVDVLNVLNDTAEEAIATHNYFSPNFAVGSSFVLPRRAMVGIKLSF